MLLPDSWEIVPDDQLDAALVTCGWCGGMVSDDDPIAAVTANCLGSIAEYEGKMVLVPLSTGRCIPGSVGTPESELRKDGKDIAFMCCSEECAGELRDALEEEMRLAAGTAPADGRPS